MDRVDAIVSEWMGHALLYENMLPSVLFARDRYLNPPTPLQGADLAAWRRQRLFPCKATIFIAGFSEDLDDEEEEGGESKGQHDEKHWKELSDLYQVRFLCLYKCRKTRQMCGAHKCMIG